MRLPPALRHGPAGQNRASPARRRLTVHAPRVDHDTPGDDLRQLTLWLTRRRAVDEAVALLTEYGPAACDRVHAHLDALRRLLSLEQEAFAAVEACAPSVPQSPLPGACRPPSAGDATVHSISAARNRSVHH